MLQILSKRQFLKGVFNSALTLATSGLIVIPLKTVALTHDTHDITDIYDNLEVDSSLEVYTLWE